MKRKKYIFWVLLTSFLTGIGMITNGLASLPQPYEQPRMVILSPDPEESKIIQPKQKIDSETISFATPQQPNKHTYKVKSGDTFSGILQGMKIDDLEVAYVTSEINDKFRLNRLRAGTDIDIELYDDVDNIGVKHLKTLKFKPSITEYVEVNLREDGELEVKHGEIPLKKVMIQATGEIEGSLYQSAIRAGVTESVMSQLIAAFSHVVDFQRDIKPGHKFTVLFEAYTDDGGKFIKSNRPLYAKLQLGKKTSEIYFVQQANGTIGYFKPDGSSVRGGLLRTPIDGARITSGFGMRRHPILGYSKMHKGTDFGAPTGTPIYAAGDGKIVHMGYFGAYGNYIRIQHNGTYSTAYAHISRFARGVKNGQQVKQGQVIAYVGTTGRSTGPHLHFEVLKNGAQVNPVSVNFQISNKLTGKELANFDEQKKRVTTAFASAPTRTQLEAKRKQALREARRAKQSAEITITPN